MICRYMICMSTWEVICVLLLYIGIMALKYYTYTHHSEDKSDRKHNKFKKQKKKKRQKDWWSLVTLVMEIPKKYLNRWYYYLMLKILPKYRTSFQMYRLMCNQLFATVKLYIILNYKIGFDFRCLIADTLLHKTYWDLITCNKIHDFKHIA